MRRYFLGMVVLLGFWGAGEAVALGARLPVPGSVVGMLMLAGVLQAGWLPLDVVRPAAEYLIRIMGLLFVPPGVGLVVYFELIGREWVPIAAAAVASTISVLLVVGVMQQRMERRG